MSVDYDYELDEPEHEGSSGRRRKGRRDGGGLPKWAWIGGGALAILLLANLALALLAMRGGGDDPTGEAGPSGGFLTPEVIRAIALWVPALGSLGLAVAGFIWSGVALSRYDRTSVRWIRVGFATAALCAIGLVIAVFEWPDQLFWVAPVVVCALLVPFVLAARAAAKNRHGGGRKRRSSGSASGEETGAES